MSYDPQKHHRRSIRLKGYDYTLPGAYFVTICTQGHVCLYGQVVDDEMILNDAGRMVQRIWETIPGRFPTIRSDAYVIMPNHFHAIITITDPRTGDDRSDDRDARAGDDRLDDRDARTGDDRLDDRDARAGDDRLDNRDARAGDDRLDNRDARAGDDRLDDRDACRGNPRGCPDGADTRPRAGTRPAPTGMGTGMGRVALGDVVGAFKSITTHEYIVGVRNGVWPPFDKRIWQRNYWEHIIRNDAAYQRIKQYIKDNPARWVEDQLHPDAPPNPFNRG